MINPITSIVRLCYLHKYKSAVQHSILPLSSIRSVVLLLDSEAPDSKEASNEAEAFFNSINISLKIFCTSKNELNLWGFIKKSLRNFEGRNEDLFISLANTKDCFAARYEAMCSTAKFKIGCDQNSFFDLTILAAEGREATQVEVFKSVVDLLKKIQ